MCVSQKWTRRTSTTRGDSSPVTEREAVLSSAVKKDEKESLARTRDASPFQPLRIPSVRC